MECVNFPEEVKEQLYKLASICLCPNLSGQICMVSVATGGTDWEPCANSDVAGCRAVCCCLLRLQGCWLRVGTCQFLSLRLLGSRTEPCACASCLVTRRRW